LKATNRGARLTKMSLESSKTLGGIGAILIAIGSLGAFSGVVGILSLIGIILVLIAMKGLSEVYGERGIFDNALYGFVFGIIGIIVLLAMAVMMFLGMGWVSMEMGEGMPAFTNIWGFIGAFIVIWIVFVVFIIIEAIFYKKSFNLLAQKSGEKMFDTAGLLLLIGAILTIIFIGAILMLIAWILAAVAFFSIKTPSAQPTPTPPQPPPPPP